MPQTVKKVAGIEFDLGWSKVISFAIAESSDSLSGSVETTEKVMIACANLT